MSLWSTLLLFVMNCKRCFYFIFIISYYRVPRLKLLQSYYYKNTLQSVFVQ